MNWQRLPGELQVRIVSLGGLDVMIAMKVRPNKFDNKHSDFLFRASHTWYWIRSDTPGEFYWNYGVGDVCDFCYCKYSCGCQNWRAGEGRCRSKWQEKWPCSQHSGFWWQLTDVLT